MTTPPTTFPRFVQIVESAIRQERENALDDTRFGPDLRQAMIDDAQILQEGIEWVKETARMIK